MKSKHVTMAYLQRRDVFSSRTPHYTDLAQNNRQAQLRHRSHLRADVAIGAHVTPPNQQDKPHVFRAAPFIFGLSQMHDQRGEHKPFTARQLRAMGFIDPSSLYHRQ